MRKRDRSSDFRETLDALNSYSSGKCISPGLWDCFIKEVRSVYKLKVTSKYNLVA
jgi:hypothetical protein